MSNIGVIRVELPQLLAYTMGDLHDSTQPLLRPGPSSRYCWSKHSTQLRVRKVCTLRKNKRKPDVCSSGSASAFAAARTQRVPPSNPGTAIVVSPRDGLPMRAYLRRVGETVGRYASGPGERIRLPPGNGVDKLVV